MKDTLPPPGFTSPPTLRMDAVGRAAAERHIREGHGGMALLPSEYRTREAYLPWLPVENERRKAS